MSIWTRLRDDRGSMPAAFAYVLLASALVSLMAGATINLLTFSSNINENAAITQGVDQRYQAWVAAGADSSSDTSQACYPSTGVCASITAVATSGADTTVTIVATYGHDSITRTRTHSGAVHPVIVGFNADGSPIWKH